jgi:hypothetical protein
MNNLVHVLGFTLTGAGKGRTKTEACCIRHIPGGTMPVLCIYPSRSGKDSSLKYDFEHVSLQRRKH